MFLNRNVRTFLAFLSICGFTVCIATYIGSFSNSREDTILGWWWTVLVLGAIVLVAPICILEYPTYRIPFVFKGFRGMPNWFRPCLWLLSLLSIGRLAWLIVHEGGGVPEIIGGQYVLDSHRRIVGVLVRSEYLKLKAAEARAIATSMSTFYFLSMTYWWFRRESNHSASDLFGRAFLPQVAWAGANRCTASGESHAKRPPHGRLCSSA